MRRTTALTATILSRWRRHRLRHRRRRRRRRRRRPRRRRSSCALSHGGESATVRKKYGNGRESRKGHDSLASELDELSKERNSLIKGFRCRAGGRASWRVVLLPLSPSSIFQLATRSNAIVAASGYR